MNPSDVLDPHRAAIRRIVSTYRAANPRVFGPASRGEPIGEDGIDLLIDAAPGMSLFDLGKIIHELGELMGMPVEVLTRDMVPKAHEAQVLREAQPV